MWGGPSLGLGGLFLGWSPTPPPAANAQHRSVCVFFCLGGGCSGEWGTGPFRAEEAGADTGTGDKGDLPGEWGFRVRTSPGGGGKIP